MSGILSRSNYTPWTTMALRCSRIMNLDALLSSAQDSRHDAGAAATMNHGNHNDRLFIRRIGDKKFAHDLKAQWTRSEIRSNVALMGKSYQFADSIQNFFPHSLGRKRTILSDEFPNLYNILRRARVKFKSLVRCHLGEFFLSRSSSRLRNPSKNDSPSMSFARPLLISS